MAFLLTPRFVPAYQPQACSPFSCYSSPRPTHRRRVVSRPVFPSFAPFLSQVDELLTELDREARRAQHHQRQQRKRVFRARFDVRENDEGYEVEGEIPGFEQHHVEIEVSNENTLRVVGNTERKNAEQEQLETSKVISDEPDTTKDVKTDGVTLAEPEDTTTSTEAQAEIESIHSDISSHKSFQATVEDDFEDLGAETSSLISSSTEAQHEQPREPKGKKKVVDETAVEQQQQDQQQTEVTTTNTIQPEETEQYRASFERTFHFPDRINAAGVKAALRNGVLSIQVPRAPKHQVRQVTIQ